MKHRFMLIVGVLVLVAAPYMVFAQDAAPRMPSMSLPGLPNMGGIWDMSKLPEFTPPTFFAGYSNRGTSFSSEWTPGVLPAGVTKFKHGYEQSAIALGVQEAIPLGAFNGKTALLASWWVHLPLTQTASDEDYFTTAAGVPPVLTQDWDAESTWWWVDGIGAYMFSPNFAGLLGFRYEQYVISFDEPEPAIASTIAEESDVTSNGYVPLVGVMWAYNGARTKMSALAVGFPTLLGDITFNQTVAGNRIEMTDNYTDGYFLELYLDYKYKMFGSDLGAFFRYNTTMGKWNGDVDLTPIGGATATASGEGGAVYRNAWTVGASVNVPFSMNLPFM